MELFDFSSDENGVAVEDVPEYVRAADLHNLANSNRPISSPLLPKVASEAPEDITESISSFVRASVIAGTNELYNTVQTVGSWLPGSGEAQLRTTAEALAEVDSSLLDYYSENQDLVDVVGFTLSSIAPGMGGVKALRVFQGGQRVLNTAKETGILGSTLGRSLGLLKSNHSKYLAQAIEDTANSNAPFSFLRGNVLKTLASGVKQNVLEAAAFETAVAATMYNSPMFTHMDASDMFWNAAMFAGLGGAIGGTIGGILDIGTIKNAVRGFTKETAPYSVVAQPSKFTTPENKLMLYVMDRERVPAIPLKNGDPTHDAMVTRIERAFQTSTRQRETDMLQAAMEYAKGDADLGQAIFQQAKLGSSEDVISLLLQSAGVGRLSTKLQAEQELKSLGRKLADPLKATDELFEQQGKLSVRYLHITGERAGTISETMPLVSRVADTLPPGTKIEVQGNTVKAGPHTTTFSLNKPWNIFEANPYQVELRRIWAQKTAPLLPDQELAHTDIPLLEKAFWENNTTVRIKLADGSIFKPASIDELFTFIANKKHELAVQMVDMKSFMAHPEKLKEFLQLDTPLSSQTLKQWEKRSQDEIASIVNVKNRVLSGEIVEGERYQYFADRAAQKEYNEYLVKTGARHPNEPEIDIVSKPSMMKIAYRREAIKDQDGNVLQGAAILQQQQREFQDAMDRAVAAYLPAGEFEKLPTLSNKDVFQADIFGPGRSFAATSNQGYSTLGNQAEWIGLRTQAMIQRQHETFHETFDPALISLGRNKDAAIEFSVLNQRLRAIPDAYILDPDGESKLVLKRWRDYEDGITKGSAGKNVKPFEHDEKIPLEIPIENQETLRLIETYIARDTERVNAHAAVRSVRGTPETRKAGVFYPIAPDPKNYRHFAFVEDKSIVGTGRSRMLYAQSAKDLDEMISKVEAQMPAHWKIYTKGEAESYYKALGQFDYEKSLHDVNFDAQLQRMGVSSPVIIPTEPQKIIDEFLNWNLQRESQLVRTLVTAKYQPQMDTLIKLGKKYTNIATSKTGSLSTLKYAENVVDNPYNNYVRTMLAIPKEDAVTSWWVGPQRQVETAISNMYDDIAQQLKASKSDADLLALNDTLKKYGYAGVNYDAAIEKLANHVAPKSILTTFARKANGLLATLTLRLDSLQAATNVISNHILYYPELRSIISSIERGDEAAVGKLTQLAKIKVPGTEDLILSPAKIHGNAINNYYKALREDTGWIQKYRELGYLTSISNQFKHIIDEVSMTGKETVQGMAEKTSRLNKIRESLVRAADTGEVITGNKLAEEYNRFVAADSARQIMQIAVDHGIITEPEMWANISTFVRRTQGTYNAFLRPGVFQGAFGQAMGLFQTYQFNLMQQIFRHVAEGDAKDAMLMLGLQGTIYGLQGMPAFNAINTHILGTMTGNPQHKDIYSTVYAAGNTVGDWVMYGAASNILGLVSDELKTNLYSRGDINPRHLTIIPTNFEDIPIFNAAAKVFGGLKETFKNVEGGGAIWGSLLRGIEHSSVNRPLTGFAQILQATNNPKQQVTVTTSQGNIAYQNNLLSLANLTRVLGGKPFDQAITQDLHYRIGVYAADFKDRRESLGKRIKTHLLSGQVPAPEEIEKFAQQYVGIGGDIENWNRFWMRQLGTMEKTTLDRVTDVLKNPTVQRMQRQMQGAQIDPEVVSDE